MDLSFKRLTRFYCISHFVGQFLPTSIGGDAYRVYRVLPLVEPRSRAVTSIVIDRIVGLAALLCLGAIGAVFLMDHFKLPPGYLTALGFGALGAVIGGVALYLGWFGLLRRKLQHLKIVVAIQQDLMQLLRAGWTWLPLLCMALVFQVIAVGIVYPAVAAVLLRVAVLPLSCACGVLYWRESHGKNADRVAAIPV